MKLYTSSSLVSPSLNHNEWNEKLTGWVVLRLLRSILISQWYWGWKIYINEKCNNLLKIYRLSTLEVSKIIENVIELFKKGDSYQVVQKLWKEVNFSATPCFLSTFTKYIIWLLRLKMSNMIRKCTTLLHLFNLLSYNRTYVG